MPAGRFSGAILATVGIEAPVLIKSGYHTELIDGLEVEKPPPKRPHGLLESFLASWLLRRLPETLDVMTELNVLCGGDRLVPDLIVASGTAAYQNEDLAEAPLLAIEILSEGQTISELVDRCTRLLPIGTGVCWIIDPAKRKAWNYTLRDLSETGSAFPDLLFGMWAEYGQFQIVERLPADALWSEVKRRKR